MGLDGISQTYSYSFPSSAFPQAIPFPPPYSTSSAARGATAGRGGDPGVLFEGSVPGIHAGRFVSGVRVQRLHVAHVQTMPGQPHPAPSATQYVNFIIISSFMNID